MKPRELNITDPVFGEIKLLVFYSTDDSWGLLEPLKNTSIAYMLRIVTGEDLSLALYGRAKPLLTKLGPRPSSIMNRVPEQESLCSLNKTCIGWDKNYCKIGGASKRKTDPPGPPSCYVSRIHPIAELLIKAAKEDRHSVIVQGEQFVI